jgi:hypothetical protein
MDEQAQVGEIEVHAKLQVYDHLWRGLAASPQEGLIGRLAFSIAERWFIEMQILRTARRLHDPGQTLTARGPVPDERH